MSYDFKADKHTPRGYVQEDHCWLADDELVLLLREKGVHMFGGWSCKYVGPDGTRQITGSERSMRDKFYGYWQHGRIV